MVRSEVTDEGSAFLPGRVVEAKGRRVLSVDEQDALHPGGNGWQLRCGGTALREHSLAPSDLNKSGSDRASQALPGLLADLRYRNQFNVFLPRRGEDASC